MSTDESENKTIIDDFEILEEIGGGAFSKVHIARHIPTNIYVAAKIVNLTGLKEEEFNGIMREISVFLNVDHPSICSLYRLSVSAGKLYFFMEFASKGTLLSYVNNNKGISEPEAQKIFVQLYSAIRHLHIYHFLAHRDLKLENILFDCKGNIKLTDFGLAGTFYCNQMRTFVGTPGYTPPEIIIGGEYDEKCDVWSLGICLYAMLTASLPFTTQSNNYRQLCDEASQLTFPPNFSPMLQDLLRKMFVVKPSNRMTLIQLQSHPWLRGLQQISTNILPQPIIFYRVTSIDDISMFKRKPLKPNPKIMEECAKSGFAVAAIQQSIEEGLVNELSTIYFAMKCPLMEKPEIPRVTTTTPIVKVSRQRSIEQASKTFPDRSPNPKSFKTDSFSLRKSAAKTLITPTRKFNRVPLKKP